MNIVVADGLVRAALSPERQFHGLPSNLGAVEIARLMGRGRGYGEGPLPNLLRAAVRNAGTGVILLREVSPAGAGESTSEEMLSEWVEPLEPLLDGAAEVSCPPGQIAWEPLIEAIAATARIDEAAVRSGEADLGFLVVGCQTEKRVQTIAMFLRSVLGFERVAVCPHLVGSATSEAHYATLRHNLPRSGVAVMLDLESAARWAGVEPGEANLAGGRPCRIEPAEARE